eukprot:CAMPEP_0179246526 /NCGR_PEP_ID=MMETSP0797-20121207/19140_1 /TAXON_ID=47934 /ORGANISM="Dinophysis acuminata, Strain DAEP01" /LENGTH=41 /DNA_ID= /DNA_START= /DNA_END= /DNA_ORIENTATION=
MENQNRSGAELSKARCHCGRQASTAQMTTSGGGLKMCILFN